MANGSGFWLPREMTVSQDLLGSCVAELGGFAEPEDGFVLIGLGALAAGVHEAELEHAEVAAGVGGL